MTAPVKRKYLIRSVPKPAPQAPIEGSDERAVRLFAKSRHELIAETAYYRAERRGFSPGDPDEDWREAEREVEELLRRDCPF